MVGHHHRLNGCECAQTPGDSGGQRSLACGTPWGHKEPDATEQLDSNSPLELGYSWAGQRTALNPESLQYSKTEKTSELEALLTG